MPVVTRYCNEATEAMSDEECAISNELQKLVDSLVARKAHHSVVQRALDTQDAFQELCRVRASPDKLQKLYAAHLAEKSRALLDVGALDAGRRTAHVRDGASTGARASSGRAAAALCQASERMRAVDTQDSLPTPVTPMTPVTLLLSAAASTSPVKKSDESRFLVPLASPGKKEPPKAVPKAVPTGTGRAAQRLAFANAGTNEADKSTPITPGTPMTPVTLLLSVAGAPTVSDEAATPMEPVDECL